MSDSVPVTSVDDVLAIFPEFLKSTDPSPVRDDIFESLLAMFREYQSSAAYTAAQSDPMRAVGAYLEGLAADHELFKLASDSDESLRAVFFESIDLVTPATIAAALNVITAPYTTALAQILEPDLDCAFVTDGTGEYDSAFVGTNPRYPDRLYPDDALENDGYVRPQSQSDGFWIFSGDQIGCEFVVRLPDLSAADEDFSFSSDADPDEMFISDNTDDSGSEIDGTVISFSFTSAVTSEDLYNSVVAVLDRIKGQGIRYEVYVDPSLG